MKQSMGIKPSQKVQVPQLSSMDFMVFPSRFSTNFFSDPNPHGSDFSEEWAHALNLFQHFSSVGHNVVTYSASISALEKDPTELRDLRMIKRWDNTYLVGGLVAMNFIFPLILGC